MFATPAFSQSTSNSASSDILVEVVVTAQKREEKLRDVPFSVSAVTAEALETRGINDAIDLAKVVPSLGAYQVSPGQNLLTIRGISTWRGDSALVGTYLDEIPLAGGVKIGDSSGLDVRAFDLARVEVLKGPQGTLFGEGAIGGVIRYITNDPELDGFGANLKGAYFGTRDGEGSSEYSGMVNAPLIDDVLGLRVAGSYQNHGGWIKNVSTGEHDFNDDESTDVRAKMLYNVTDRLTLTGLVQVHRMTFDGQNIVNVLPYGNSEFQQSVFPDFPTNGYNRFELYNLTASLDLGFATLLSSTSYNNLRVSNSFGWVSQIIPGEGEAPGGGWEVLIPPSPGKQTNFGEEIRLASNGNGPFTWLIGANYKDTDTDILSAGDNPVAVYFKVSDDPSVPLVTENYGGFTARITSEAMAAFADASYKFWDRLELGGGVRYFEEDRRRVDHDRLGELTGDSLGNFQKTTYRVFARYRLDDRINLYANTATGFRSGGFNIPAAVAFGAPGSYEPEESIFYEVGAKTFWLQGRVNFDLAYYDGRYRDQVQANFRFDDEGHGYGYLANAGDATITGVEFALDVMPIRDLRIGLSGNIPETKFTKTSPSAPVLPGDPIDFVPEFEYVFSADYDFQWSSNVEGFMGLNATWKGEQQNTNRDSGIGYVINIGPELTFIDARIGAEFDGYRVTLFGRNLSDERGVLFPEFSGIRPQARPRQIGFSVEKDF